MTKRLFMPARSFVLRSSYCAVLLLHGLVERGRQASLPIPLIAWQLNYSYWTLNVASAFAIPAVAAPVAK